MSKAPRDGTYTTTDEFGVDHKFKIMKGDVVPDGATFAAAEDGDDAESEATEERAKQPAPENRARGRAPENRAAATGENE